jgi:hypothetical protein
MWGFTEQAVGAHCRAPDPFGREPSAVRVLRVDITRPDGAAVQRRPGARIRRASLRPGLGPITKSAPLSIIRTEPLGACQVLSSSRRSAADLSRSSFCSQIAPRESVEVDHVIGGVLFIVQGAAFGHGARAFPRVPLELKGAVVMLNHVSSKSCRPSVELGHRPLNEGGPEVVSSGRQPLRSRSISFKKNSRAMSAGRSSRRRPNVMADNSPAVYVARLMRQ